jgi:hypothetical protein
LTLCGDEVDNFSHKWELQMSDFTPDFVNVIPLPYRRREVFYENITIVPCRFRGAFLLDESKDEKMDFEIVDPHGTVLYTKTGTYDIFDINLTVAGIYKIFFANEHVSVDINDIGL